MEPYFLYAGLSLCLFALWALVRHDWLRLTRSSRRTCGTVIGYSSNLEDGVRTYAARYVFHLNGAEYEVTDPVFFTWKTLSEGAAVHLVYPEGYSHLARPPRLLLSLTVYAVIGMMTAVLAAKLGGWLGG